MNSIVKATQATTMVFEMVGASGGELHIVLDDWNVEDDNIMYCKREIDRLVESKAITDSDQKIYMDCIDCLMGLSEEERISAVSKAFDVYDKDDSVHKLAKTAGK